DEKSQLQNKEKAFRILRARLLAARQAEQAAEVAGERRAQAGAGGRSEEIRSYNFKESRAPDHRVGLTIRRLGEAREGAGGGVAGRTAGRTGGGSGGGAACTGRDG